MRDEAQAAAINETRHNPRYLSDFALDEKINATASLETALLGADWVMVAVPSQALRSCLIQAKPYLDEVPLVLAAKGIENKTLMTMDEVVAITTRDVLALGNSLGLKTIAIPAIGTGNRGFPIEKAAQIMVTIAASHLAGQTTLEKVTFAVVSDGVYRAFESLLTLLPE